MALAPEEFIDLIVFAGRTHEEELIFRRWIAGPQFQISFEEFKAQLIPKPLKSEQDILADVKAILDSTI